MPHIKKFFISFILCFALIIIESPSQAAFADSSEVFPFPFVILSQYEETLNIGDEFYVIAVTSSDKQATWKSSNSSVASVNTYGKVTAKKAGIAAITAKIKGAEASCYVTVNRTKVVVSKLSASIEHGETLRLTASTSNQSKVTWKSSKKSIATVDEYGNVIGLKPGQTTITATADGSTSACSLTVKAPTVKLDKTSVTLYRGQTTKLNASVSSAINPKWKTNRKSVAVVDSNGAITAMKNGTATITATVDGVSVTCEVTVQKPDITLSATELFLKKGSSSVITAAVSSSNQPIWSSSNSNVATVNTKGEVTAVKKGTAYIYVSEDGTKVRCTVKVTE